MEKKVSIIIPTKNRYKFIKRQLQYYKNVQSHHPVYIGDSSEGSNKIELIEIIKEFQRYLDIKYFDCPNMDGPTVKMLLADQIKENYCAYSGDDDFLIPKSLTKCANFLEINKDFRTAQGKRFIFCLEKEKINGNIKWIQSHGKNGETLSEETAEKRLLAYSKNYWGSQFSVHRTEEFLEDSSNYKLIKKEDVFHELIHCFTFIARGKSKFIDCLYLVRQGHEDRMKHDNIFDWISGSEWNNLYNHFINSISQILIEKDGMIKEKSINISHKIFWKYLSPGLRKIIEDRNNDEEGKYNNIKKILKKSIQPKYLAAMKNIITNLYSQQDNLLNHKSKYYQDFEPLKITIEK